MALKQKWIGPATTNAINKRDIQVLVDPMVKSNSVSSKFNQSLMIQQQMGAQVAQSVKCLPPAQVMIPGSWG